MRKGRVKVRRDRPSAVTWALALLVTMLMVYVLTLSGSLEAERAELKSQGARVAREVTFAPLKLYCVSFGTCTDRENARLEAARFVPRGAAGYVYARDDGYLLLAAGYDQEAEARRVAERLAEAEQLQTDVVPFSSRQVRLRVTAAAEQIAAVIQADEALRAQAEQLEALAFRLDRGEVSADSARTLVAVQSAQLRDVLAALKAIPGEDAVFRGLTAQVETLGAALELIAHESGEGELVLSGRLKHQYIDAQIQYIEFLNGLTS